MNRREFLGAASAAVFAPGLRAAQAGAPTPMLKPMALGLLISPFGALDERLKLVHDLGFSNCFLSLDGYLGQFTPALATQFRDLLDKYELMATTVEVVGPGRWCGTFLRGPSTIGLVPPATRAARIDALRQASDFAKLLGIRPGADPLRIHSRRSRRIRCIPGPWKPFAPSPSIARATGSTF